MLKHTSKLLVSKATTLRTKLGGSKKRWLLKQNNINLGKGNFIPLQGLWATSLFITFPGLFEIIAQSADGTAILIYGMYVDVGRKSGNGCLGTFCTLGYCLILKKVPNELVSPNWLWWGWLPLLAANAEKCGLCCNIKQKTDSFF